MFIIQSIKKLTNHIQILVVEMLVIHRNHVDEEPFSIVDLMHKRDVSYRQHRVLNYLYVDRIQLEFESFERIHVHYLENIFGSFFLFFGSQRKH